MRTVVIDYGSGNLRSVIKALEAVSPSNEAILLSANEAEIANADRLVLPGVGAFADCKAGLEARNLWALIDDRVRIDKIPFLGICVGMQLLATTGHEFGKNSGFDWIKGDVKRIKGAEDLAIPNMGWHPLQIHSPHPVLKGLEGVMAWMYFVHSYAFEAVNKNQVLAHIDYGDEVTAVIGHENIIATQFHPEKSQKGGLKLLENFFKWKP